MMNEMTPRQYAEQVAFDIVEMDQMERLIHICKNMAAVQCTGDVHPDEFDPACDGKPKDKVMTPDEAVAAHGVKPRSN